MMSGRDVGGDVPSEMTAIFRTLESLMTRRAAQLSDCISVRVRNG